jgi:hypothetical protein
MDAGGRATQEQLPKGRAGEGFKISPDPSLLKRGAKEAKHFS